MSTSSARGFRGSQSYVWDTSKPLGQGATSVVYMGRNKKTGDEVAVKVFNTLSLQRPMTVQLREFEVMKRLNHENIVKLISVEEEVPNGINVLVMEYCTHGNLYNLLENPENNFGLIEEEFVNVLHQVTSGVKHLRDNDIIHRDIKPGNILRSVKPDGRSVYKLTDFGAARELQDDEEFFSLYGTDEYLHPDMYEKAVLRRPRGQHFGLYVDLWSLGVTFYHAATGQLPFRPFGGRRNREMMHAITTKKEHGVISGVQTKEGGSVKWSRDLPSTCRLSRGLKKMVTPLLVSLFEKDQAKTITFDTFFTIVNDITTRTPYHLFCPSAFAQLVVYAKAQDDLGKVRQCITDQIDIPGGAQLLLHDGKVLNSDARELISTLITSETKGNPIIVINRLPEYKMFEKPCVESFMEIPIITNVDADYPLSKKILGVIHSMRNAVRYLKTSTDYMHLSVKLYSNYVNQKSKDLEQALKYINKYCGDSAVLKDQLFQLSGVEAEVFRFLADQVHTPMMVKANMLQTLQHTGKLECTKINQHINSQLKKAEATLSYVKNGLQQEAVWDRSVGCVPSDKCIEKMDNLISRLTKIMSSFKEDRSKRHLNNNEEQIHRVDKNKMKELTITAKTLLEDHCIGKAQCLFSTFKEFYSKKVQINDTAEKLSTDLDKINELQTKLVHKTKTTMKECISQASGCMNEIIQIKPNQENEKASKDESLASDSNGPQSRSEKLGQFMHSLQSWKEDLTEVKVLLNENTQMISRFNENHCSMEGEDDNSWELVKTELLADAMQPINQ